MTNAVVGWIFLSDIGPVSESTTNRGRYMATMLLTLYIIVMNHKVVACTV